MNDKCTFCPAPATATEAGVPVCADCQRIFFPGERGSALAWAMFAVTALLLAAFCVLCLAASPRGELARAWIAGLLGIGG